MKNVSTMVAMLMLLVVATFTYLHNPVTIYSSPLPLLEKDEVYVIFFELPDGEATLIKTDQSKNILINTGSEKSEEELLLQLEELDVKKIDKLILTKQTVDYCGNANRLIERYNIDETFYAGKLSEACKGQLTSHNLSKWKTGNKYTSSDNLQFKVLQAEPSGEMSLDIVYGKNSILYLSNSNVENEEQLLKHSLQPKILKIADYAKGKSPSASLLSKIDPHISIVFNCEDCVPNEGLIERLNESWIDVYQLKHVGTTIIRMNLNDYEVLS